MIEKPPRLAAALTTIGMLLAISGASLEGRAAIVDFISGGDFHTASNWSNNMVPTLGVDVYYIQNGLTSTFSGGSTSLRGMVVGNDSSGTFSMTGGNLSVLDSNMLEVGRERFPKGKQGDYNNNGVVDAADYTVWRDTFGQEVLNQGDGADGDESGAIDTGDYDFWKSKFGTVTKGGNILLTGNSILTANGVIVGRRTKGLLSVGPTAHTNVQGINHVTGDVRTEYLRVGSYGPDFGGILSEPGLEGDGLVINQGTLSANVLLINEHGANGEFRLLPGGKVNLNGGVVMSYCDVAVGASCGLIANPSHMSAKVSIFGSGGTFDVGRYDPLLSPPIDSFDPRPQLRRDIYSDFPATATFSFTADAGGLTPITLVDNGAELSGTAQIGGTNLLLNLDAYTGTDPLTLINAAPGHLSGTFGTVTFLGSRMATVNYDVANGDVFLSNFHSGAGSGGLAGVAVPEPSYLSLVTICGFLMIASGARTNRQRAHFECPCLKGRA